MSARAQGETKGGYFGNTSGGKPIEILEESAEATEAERTRPSRQMDLLPIEEKKLDA